MFVSVVIIQLWAKIKCGIFKNNMLKSFFIARKNLKDPGIGNNTWIKVKIKIVLKYEGRKYAPRYSI